jgi:hypothetical protein
MGTAVPRYDWQWAYLVQAHALEPPELPDTLAGYDALDPGVREKLEDARMDYHSELPLVETRAISEMAETIRVTVHGNRAAPTGPRRGFVVDGPANVGKTTFLLHLGRMWELELRRRYPDRFASNEGDDPEFLRRYRPVAFLSLPQSPTVRMIAERFAEYLGLPTPRSANADRLTSKVLDCFARCETEVVLIDDIHFLDFSQRDGRVANDYLKYLANHTNATFVMAGVNVKRTAFFSEGSPVVDDAATSRDAYRSYQTSSRFARMPLEPFGQALLSGKGTQRLRDAEQEEWCRLLLALEGELMLYNHEVGSMTRTLWWELLERSDGMIGSATHLVRTAAKRAIRNGHERVDKSQLDLVLDDYASGEQRRKGRRRPGSR